MATALAAFRSGRVVLAHYQGTISWTWNTGSAIEAVEAGLLNGEVYCDVTYTTPEGSYAVSGPGLMDISLGLKPDEEAPPAQRIGQWYSFRVTRRLRPTTLNGWVPRRQGGLPAAREAG